MKHRRPYRMRGIAAAARRPARPITVRTTVGHPATRLLVLPSSSLGVGTRAGARLLRALVLGAGLALVDRNGNVFVTDAGNGRIEKFTNTGIFVAQWGSLGSSDGQFDDPIGLAVDRDGNVFVGDFNSRIQKFACP